ncbi:MAG: hypothetical protein ACRBB6_10015, partial [Neptuniibacter sp.]
SAGSTFEQPLGWPPKGRGQGSPSTVGHRSYPKGTRASNSETALGTQCRGLFRFGQNRFW